MEYLPEDINELEEKKLKEFREYILVVLLFVKTLLIKYSEQTPNNPIKVIRDFFENIKIQDEMK